jgi:hypothetical protein
MPYENAWTDTYPPGSLPARDIDAAFQRLRREIHERMDDMTATGWEADPVIPAGAGTIAKSKVAQYSSALPAGSRATNYLDVRAMLTLNIAFLTSSAGQFVLNLNEVNIASGDVDDWSANNFLGFVYQLRAQTNGNLAHASLVGIDGVANTLTFELRYATNNLTIQVDNVFGNMVLYFSEVE